MAKSRATNKRLSKRKLVAATVADMYRYGISHKQAFNLFKYYDDLVVSQTLCEAFSRFNCINDFDRFVNERVRWTYQDRDIVEDFHFNVTHLLSGI